MYPRKLSVILYITAGAILSLATPPSLRTRDADASPSVVLCQDVTGNCITVPVSTGSCVDFSGGLSFLNDMLSAATIPDGLVCIFFDQSQCQDSAEAILTGGSWSFFNVPGLIGNSENFNDVASSMVCEAD